MIERLPFDPGDPFDAMAESFRRQLVDMFLEADKATIFRELEASKRLQCFIAGSLSGLIGIAFAHVKSGDNEGREALVKYIGDCLAPSRQIAEEIFTNGGPNARATRSQGQSG